MYCLISADVTYMCGCMHVCFELISFVGSVSKLEGFVSNKEQTYEDPIEE